MQRSMNPLGRLDQVPRVSLAHLPTPLELMPNLTKAVGGATLYIKRDDCTGLAMGGNKARQLEFYLGQAKADGADTILITGAVQSNYVRMAAAGARKLGMAVHIQLEQRVPLHDHAYQNNGNVLLDKMLGATLHSFPRGEDEAGADKNLEDVATSVRAKGGKPFVIHLGLGHDPLGALGYVDAARETLGQSLKAGLNFDEVVVASGSGHTHAGFLFGAKALETRWRVVGGCVRRASELQVPRILDHCNRIATQLGVPNPVQESDVHLDDHALAPGYGRLNEPALNAIRMAARHEAILLDPVYTAKSMAVAIARAKALGKGKNVLYIHTGGVPAVFGYEPLLAPSL